jgi:uncharacterized membrane protein (DUF4010 family)
LRAALQFAVLALVVLPLLPEGPFGGSLDIRPRSLWTIVLFFSALNFAGFLARRAVGPRAGYALTGMLGGLISSTGVSLDFSRKSRREPALGGPLAWGVIGACTVLIPRVIVVSSVLNPAVGLRLCTLLAVPLICGAAMMLIGWRREPDTTEASEPGPESPLRLAAAVQMAVAFQVTMSIIAQVHDLWGTTGLYRSAAILGLTDMDALTMSMSRLSSNVTTDVAARAVGIGVLANTALKLTLAATIGVGRFRRVAVVGLAVLGAASVIGLLLLTAGA